MPEIVNFLIKFGVRNKSNIGIIILPLPNPLKIIVVGRDSQLEPKPILPNKSISLPHPLIIIHGQPININQQASIISTNPQSSIQEDNELKLKKQILFCHFDRCRGMNMRGRCWRLSCLRPCRSISSRDGNRWCDGPRGSRSSRGRIIATCLRCSIRYAGSSPPCCGPKAKTRSCTRFGMGSASISVFRQ
jgi:hypothetical protein